MRFMCTRELYVIRALSERDMTVEQSVCFRSSRSAIGDLHGGIVLFMPSVVSLVLEDSDEGVFHSRI